MASKWLIVPVAAVLSLGVAFAGRADDKKPAEAPRGLQFTGSVQADAVAMLSARVAGAVDKVNVNDGDRVKKGQLLIELSAPELKDDLDAAAAKLEQAKAEVEQAEATVQAARARSAEADAVLEGAQDVYKRAAANPAGVPDSVLAEAKAQFRKTEAARNAAAAEVARAQAGVKVAQAGVSITEAGVRRAQTRLGFTRIVAPFDGVASRLTVDAGATVEPPTQGVSAPLVAVERDDVVRVYFDVDERSAARVVIGAPVVIRAPALPDVEFQGKVTRTTGTVNRDTGTLRAEIDLPNPDGKLRPGMFVTVEVKKDAPGK